MKNMKWKMLGGIGENENKQMREISIILNLMEEEWHKI